MSFLKPNMNKLIKIFGDRNYFSKVIYLQQEYWNNKKSHNLNV